MRSYQSVTTDIVIFTIENNELKVLLIKRAKKPFKNQWALPGGFLLENEPPEKAALRVLESKTGVSNIYPHTHFGSKPTGLRFNKSKVSVGVYMEQLYTFPGSGRDPRGNIITIAFVALVPKSKIMIRPSERTQTPTLYPLKKLPQLAFDHRSIIAYALKRLRSKLEYTNIIYSLLPRYFTFNDLQQAYEIILGHKLDKRNFRKKFMLLKLIQSTSKVHKGTRQRPAKLYQFISRKPAELKKFF